MRKVMKLLLLATSLSVATPSWSQQAVVDVGAAFGNPGSTVSLPIDLATNQSIAALQLDLTYPSSALTPIGATMGGAASNHLIASAIVGGVYRLVIYSPTNAPLGSSRLANVTFSISGGVPAQTVPIGIQAVILANASASSIPPTTLDPGSINVTLAGGPALAISTTQTSGPSPATAAAQVLGYSIVVANTGTTSHTGVSVTGTLPGGASATLAGPVESISANGILDLAETWTYTTSYTVTQANMDAGAALVNTARVTTAQVPGPTQSVATTQISQSPALTIAKTQTSGPNPVTAAGQVLGYSVVLSNTGNINQTAVSVTDMLPSGSIGVLTGPIQSISNNAILEVGETWSYTGSYVVSQVNMDAGAALVNTARVTTSQVAGPTQATAVTPIDQNPALTISNNQTSGPNPVSSAGQVLGYTIVVGNPGNISQTGVNVSDTLPSGSAGVLPAPIQSITTNSILEIGETWTYTISYTATQSDIDIGAALVNTARVSTTQSSTPIEDTATTPVAASLIFANGFEPTRVSNFEPGVSDLLIELAADSSITSATLLVGLTADDRQAFRIDARDNRGSQELRVVAATGTGFWASGWIPVQRDDVLRLHWWSAQQSGGGGLSLWANDAQLMETRGVINDEITITSLRGIDPDGAYGDPLASGHLRALRVLEADQ